MRQSLEILNVMITLTSIKFSEKRKPISKKLEYRFLIKSTTSENVALPYTTNLPKANVKTNRMRSTK